MYYGGFMAVGLGSSLVAGMLPQTVIARGFRKDIGKANGAFAMGSGIGGALVPVMAKVIDNLGWRTTLLLAGIGFLALSVPLSFVMRSRPADYGMIPDGKTPDVVKGLNHYQSYDFSIGIKEALKMWAFWHLAIVSMFQNSVVATIQLYAMPYLTDIGMSRATASMVVMLYTLISLPTRIPMGMLSDTFRRSYIVAVSVALQGVGILLFWVINGTSPFWLILLFAVIYGIGVGGKQAAWTPIVAEYFGTRNFGTIFGLISIFTTLSAVVSQPLTGWIYDKYHDYKVWWLVLFIFGVVALAFILTIPRALKKGKLVTDQA